VPRIKFDIAEIAQEFMAAYGGWHERMQIAKVEARMAAERVENEASYLAGGRRFQRLTNAALKRRWIVVLRRDLGADRRRRNEMDDLSAELSLRKIGKIDLPEDVRNLVAGTPRAGVG